MMPFHVSHHEILHSFGTPKAPLVVDVCLDEDRRAIGGIIPGAIIRDAVRVDDWAADLPHDVKIVVACQRGRKLSQGVAATLLARGLEAGVLTGGMMAWVEAGGPRVGLGALARYRPREGALWVTRRGPKIDRVACPWLVRRFFDRKARVLFVDPPEVLAVAERFGATPFDIEGVTLSHSGPLCSFDTMLAAFGLADFGPLQRLAPIVRGADTADFSLSEAANGLLAVSLGLSALYSDDDHGMIETAAMLYDGLYAWIARAANETHSWAGSQPQKGA